MEPIEEGEQTISIFGVEVLDTVVVEELGVEKFKERNVVEGAEVKGESNISYKNVL